MNALENIAAKARARPVRIVLPEGEDPRIARGARAAADKGLAHPILLGDPGNIARHLDGRTEGLEIPGPLPADTVTRLTQALHQARAAKGMSAKEAADAIRNPLNLAAIMVRKGHADGMVAGAVATTAETVGAALRLIGRAPAARSISSFFIMTLAPGSDEERAVIFADCGLIVEPSPAQLGQIAVASAQSCRELLDLIPRVAMLSFSTKASASHERIDRVTEAMALAREAEPDLLIDGELQFDAAFVPAVATSKAPGSPLEGAANVFIFPNLEAGNIGYKIAQRVGGASAVGPILQGLARPANDLSRGCTAEDVTYLIAVTVAQAALAE